MYLRTIFLAIATLSFTFSDYNISSVKANTSQDFIAQNIKQQTKGITTRSLEVGKIKLSMSEQVVRRLLGKPLKVENKFFPAIGNVRTLKYSGITIDLDEGVQPRYFTVYQITVTSPKYATVNGIKVGDSQAKVLKVYGKPPNSENGQFTTLSYGIDEPSPAGLNFTIKNGKVAEIFCFYLMN
ncbi:hypothetical protein CLI64_20700 [Nostoc sp. CENA543]|uniref:hypothetical protein n=1 Tax=Nostoc sp. CENA543 TaxID=1869241 RepID=UPI000CA39CF5|nr:hypothetical protein [Nostoc sp. CENA543]AUT02615.1 hypothetical protein CLI64_20700 [Nostoc sp. CENA543]